MPETQNSTPCCRPAVALHQGLGSATGYGLRSVLCIWLLLLLGSAQLQAQRVVVSQELSVGDDDRYELFAGAGGQVIVYRDNPNAIELAAYNEKLEQVWSRELGLDKPRPNPIGALMSRGEVVVFYTYRRERGLYVKMHRYSDAGNLTDSLTVTELSGDFLNSNYALQYDPEGKFALLTHQKDLLTWMVIAVEVATGRKLYERKLVLESGSNTVTTEEAAAPYVDPLGSIYFWGQRDNRRSRLEDHVIEMTRIDIAGQVANAKIPLPETLVFDLELGVDEANRKVVFGGYYAENPDEAAGVMLLRLDYDLGGAAELVTSGFTPTLIASIEPKERRPEGIAHLDALDLIFRKDGGVLVIGEQRRATLRTVGGRSGYFGATMKTDYLYEDIVLSVVGGAAGGATSKDWHEVLPKKQFSQDDGAAFSGYFLAWTPSQMRLIYNDEVRSGGTVSEYTLDGLGDIERHSIMNTEYQNLWLRHEAGIQVSGTDIVIPSERRNRLKLVRLSYGS